MPSHDTPTQDNDDPIDPLMCALEDALNTPMMSGDALLRQAHILDLLLHAVVRDTLTRSRKYGHSLSGRTEALNLALRIQKQCADTHRTAAAMDYMQAITPVPARAPVKVLKQHKQKPPASPDFPETK